MRKESGSTRAFTSGEVNLSPFEMTALASEGFVQRIQDQARPCTRCRPHFPYSFSSPQLKWRHKAIFLRI